MFSKHIDTRLFIDLQYQDVHDAWEHGFRPRFVEDYHGEKCTPGSDLPVLITSEKIKQRERASSFHYQWITEYHERVIKWKNWFKRNINSENHETHRFTGHSHNNLYDYKYLKETYKEFATFYNNPDDHALIEFLNDLRGLYASDLPYKFLDIYNEKHSSEIHNCDDCGDFYHSDDGHSTSSDSVVCSSCIDNYYWSECMSTYIHCDDAYCVYDSADAYRNEYPDDRCTWSYGQREFYEVSDGFISDVDEYEEITSEDDDEDEYYEQTEEDRQAAIRASEENQYLSSYHSSNRPYFVVKNSGNRPALGVEIEVYAPDRLEFLKNFREVFTKDDFLTERDGSLDHLHGVEIISHPNGYDEWGKLAPQFFDVLHDNYVIGFNEPAGKNYGIHVTIDRKHFSPLAEARIAMFLSAEENLDFVRAIAQRDQIYGVHNGIGFGQYNKPTLANIGSYLQEMYSRKDVRKIGMLPLEKKIVGRGKYSPVNWKGDLAEFRIFQSSTNVNSFMKNLEFVWALQKWTMPETASGSSYSHVAFVKWLNSPQQRYDFPNLVEFVSKKVFYGTNYTPITSTWQSYLFKANEEEAIEPMAA